MKAIKTKSFCTDNDCNKDELTLLTKLKKKKKREKRGVFRRLEINLSMNTQQKKERMLFLRSQGISSSKLCYLLSMNKISVFANTIGVNSKI